MNHFADIFNIAKLSAIVDRAAADLSSVKFDTLVGRGMSGAIVVPMLAAKLGKRFAIVRKPDDSTHSDCEVEGDCRGRSVFIDDWVSTGATARAAIDAVDDCIGCYFYAYGSMSHNQAYFAEKIGRDIAIF